MSSYKDAPCSIEIVTSMLGLKADMRSGSRESWYTTCPFCGRKHKLNINVKKNTWRCAACDEAGGTLALISKLEYCSTTEAYKKIMRYTTGENIDINAVNRQKKSELKSLKLIPASSLDKRSAAYNALLENLDLSAEHKADLIKRGLSEEVIKTNGYKSTPQAQLTDIAKRVSEKAQLKGIPGFYMNADVPKVVWRKPGFFVPVRMLTGEISGMQIRYDALSEDASLEQKERYKKYVWFVSSEKNYGASSSGVENIHFAGFYPGADLSQVVLTEGPLKADISSYLSGKPFLGLTGVSNTSQLQYALEQIKCFGTKKVYIAMDSDYQTNPNVQKALNKIYRIVYQSGLPFQVLTWDTKWKGIDDLLLYKRQNNLL